ncbi:PorT family protein [uncultured Brachyspira sp.]|uniref:PorT family protein n=1 Tax=uncultured Brachyspira sp. TaxID=221953 RepID=UPI002582D01D|nr:PorT family protein [uncultured Brachyspira sp.]
MTMALGTSAFAASGFEFLLNVPFGINWSIPTGELKGQRGAMGFDAGVDAQIGYMISVKDGFGISVLGELGYSWDAYSYAVDVDTSVSDGSGSSGGINVKLKSEFVSFSFHSFKLGLLPKFNIGFGGRHGLAVGIGGGVKIPIAGQITLPGDNESLKATRQDIAEFLSPSVIGYIKASIDYYLFFTDNIAMEFGLYLGGDFGPKMAATAGGFGGNAFDFGLQLGFRFGPKA